MKLRMLGRIGFIATIFITQAQAMDTAPQKAVIKEYSRDGNYSLVFDCFNVLFGSDIPNTITYTAGSHASELIEAIIEGDEHEVVDFLKDKFKSSQLKASDCIVALYYANKVGRSKLEPLLAKNAEVQRNLMLDHQVGVGLLFLLSIEYQLESAFEEIIDCDADILQHVPPFCFDRALQLAFDRDLDNYAGALLEHPFISTKLSLKLLWNLRIGASAKSYIKTVKLLILINHS